VVALGLYPAATFALAGFDRGVLAAVAASADAPGAAIANALLHVRPGALGWIVALVAALGVLVALAQRAGWRGTAAAALGLSATVVHLLVTLVVLPRFDPLASARPLAEALGRAADDGVALLAFGFDNREELSPYLFYGRRPIVETRTKGELEGRLTGARACVLMPARAYSTLPASLRSLAVDDRSVGELHLALVSGTAGGCPDAAAIDRAPR